MPNTAAQKPNTNYTRPAALDGACIDRGSCSWFERPMSGNNLFDRLIMADVGHVGSEFAWSGSEWVPGGPIILAQSALPRGIPPGNGSTVGLKFTNTAGAFLLTTTLFPMIYADGIWLWVPINGFTASTPAAAGFYWATTSSTSVGVLTGVPMSLTGGLPPTAAQIAAAPAVTTNNYWMTQQTSIVAAALSVTIPAKMMGALGAIRSELLTSYMNSASAKTLALNFGGTAVLTQAPTTTVAARYRNTVRNRSAAKQVFPTATMGSSYGDHIGVATANIIAAVDTNADVALTVDMTLALNTDFLILEGYTVELLPSA